MNVAVKPIDYHCFQKGDTCLCPFIVIIWYSYFGQNCYVTVCEADVSREGAAKKMSGTFSCYDDVQQASKNSCVLVHKGTSDYPPSTVLISTG